MKPYEIPAAVEFNFDELKEALLEKVSVYEDMVYSDEQISAAKADRANLNRLKKALNDERIKQEREYMQPFSAFKAQINEIISIIDKPVAAIDRQVKAFEDQKREEKQQQILDYWAEKEAPVWMQVIDTKWLNASVSLKAIKAEIDAQIEKANEDIAVIRALPAYSFEAEQTYIQCLDLAKAVSEAHRLSEMAERKAAHEAEVARLKEYASARQAAEVAEMELVAEAVLEQPTAPKKYTVSFKATMTIKQARELRDFFMSRGIEYEKI